MFAFSFGVMEVNWQDLTIQATLYSEIERLSSKFSSQHCSNIIYGYVNVLFAAVCFLIHGVQQIRLYECFLDRNPGEYSECACTYHKTTGDGV
jgi:hypothetical protein